MRFTRRKLSAQPKWIWPDIEYRQFRDGPNYGYGAQLWQFPAGSYPGQVEIQDHISFQAKVIIPKDAVAGQTIHMIFEATDNGTPVLTRYQRVVITLKKR